MKDTTIATIRTGGTVAWLTVVLLVVNGVFGLDLTVADLTPYLPVIVAAGAVIYRLGRVLESRWPVLGYVLFGTTRTPTYGAGDATG